MPVHSVDAILDQPEKEEKPPRSKFPKAGTKSFSLDQSTLERKDNTENICVCEYVCAKTTFSTTYHSIYNRQKETKRKLRLVVGGEVRL
jgi:hypothetical protein